ncbi:hypothetical protein [Kitasatospora sp. MAP12-44]|uniref:plasmid mobilization protein n=1 Tax=unclassified Kitasatospora TaxID=2633591 RepID=UPI0024735B08|nr:hypothetical protein [Kitasatospora sp. MAP12-44]MDH6111371.1 uncharacterized protein (DUF1778 family) [Kitasatospora sp. MAP12-44]
MDWREEKTTTTEQTAPDPAAPPARQPRRRSREQTQRAHRLTVRFNAIEHAEIVVAASARVQTVSRFVATSTLNAARGLSADADPQDRLDRAVDELAAARAHLARVGNNLNQVAFQLNAGGYPRYGELDTVLAAIRKAVVGVDAAGAQLVGR